VKSPLQLLRIVFAYCGLDYSLRQTAANYALLHEKITDSSIAERLRACGPWVKALLAKMLELNKEQLRGKRILVVDASTIEAPGATGTDYRLHLLFDLLNLEFVQIKLTDVHTAETLRNFHFKDGDVILADRGYSDPNAIIEQKEKGVDVIVRYNSAIPLYEDDGRQIELVKRLQQAEQVEHKTMLTMRVCIKSREGKKCNLWLHAYKLPEDKANEARRRLNRQYKKRGKMPKKETLYLAGWVLILTTLTPQAPAAGQGGLDAQTIFEVYRVRWQIELTFKRLKSILNLDKLRARAKSPLSDLWLSGKMLYVLMIDRRARRKFGNSYNRLDTRRTATSWRILHIIADEVRSIVVSANYWKEDACEDVLKVISERARRRQLQRLPEKALTALSGNIAC
jgi:hypothetical protein